MKSNLSLHVQHPSRERRLACAAFMASDMEVVRWPMHSGALAGLTGK